MDGADAGDGRRHHYPLLGCQRTIELSHAAAQMEATKAARARVASDEVENHAVVYLICNRQCVTWQL